MMMKVVVCLVLTVFFCGCLCGGTPDETHYFKGIESAPIPNGCVEYGEDVCGLFDCMVDRCWCDDSTPTGPVVYEVYQTIVTEEDAENAVWVYIAELMHGENPPEERAEEMKVNRAVKLNDVFFNVFCDFDGQERVYTVAADGTILKTQCGV